MEKELPLPTIYIRVRKSCLWVQPGEHFDDPKTVDRST